MDLLEVRVFENYPVVHVDASFPAESMYLKRGYRIISYEKIETENGDFLCYHTMEKQKRESIEEKHSLNADVFYSLYRIWLRLLAWAKQLWNGISEQRKKGSTWGVVWT